MPRGGRSASGRDLLFPEKKECRYLGNKHRLANSVPAAGVIESKEVARP